MNSSFPRVRVKEFVYTRLYALTVHTRLQTSQVTRLRLDHAFPPIHSGKFLTLERHVKTFECLTEHLKIFSFAPSIIKTSTNDDLRFLFFGFGRRFFVFLFLAPSSAKTNTWSHAIELLKGSNVTKKNFKMRRTTSSTISEQYKEKTTKKQGASDGKRTRSTHFSGNFTLGYVRTTSEATVFLYKHFF